MKFCKSIFLFFHIILISLVYNVASDEIKIRKLPANFTFNAVRVRPDGEIRSMTLNSAKRDLDSEPPLAMARPSPRIVGGRRTQTKELPYQVVVGVYGEGLKCGGTIYNKEFIITAGHCIFSGQSRRNESTFFVTAGDFDVTRLERNEQSRGVTKSFFPFDFTPSPAYFDIGLLKLDAPLVYTDVVQPLPLGSPGEEYPPIGEAVVSGWGYTKIRMPGDTDVQAFIPSILRSTTINIYTKAQCIELYENVPNVNRRALHPTTLCAGQIKGGKDACQGDSGGPLRCTSGGKKYLCGIISTGLGCGLPGLPGFYTIVSKFNNWIKERAGEADQPTVDY